MNRSGRGFGLTGVAVAVAVMIVMAVFSTSAQSHETHSATIKQAPDGVQIIASSRPKN